MVLPLANPLYNVGPGGGIVTSMRGANALEQERLNAYAQQLANQIQQIKMPYVQPQEEAALKKANLFNQYYGPHMESTIGLQNAQTQHYPFLNALNAAQTQQINQLLPENLKKLQIENEFRRQREQADIANINAQAQLRQMGGTGLGVAGKEEMMFRNNIKQDNPQLRPDQLYEASNILAKGGNQLSDGTPLNPLSETSRRSLDRLIKGTTTAPALTQNLKSLQAESEIGVLDNYVQKALKPYGTNILGRNPQQVMDSFKSDKASQERLGKFIAAQALQYEIAQNRIRLANGQPGVTSTEELMRLSGQQVKTSYPKLSATAREEASRYMNEALREGLKARIKVGTSPSAMQAFGQNNASQGQMVTVQKPKGGTINLPLEGAQRLIADHPDHKIIG